VPRTLAALVAAGVLLSLLFVLVIPAAPVRLDDRAWTELASRTVSGAYHVHSSRSDGAADKPAIANAAARAGLRFLILTDHGDATRPPDPPSYIDRVLCVDAVEVSTDDGHYVALDMPRSPYPLGGSAASVVEDVARLGGFGIAAHPDSDKSALRWSDTSAPIDGLEWLNTDSQWRDSSRMRLWRAAAAYLFRPGPALVTLFERPSTLDRWDRLTSRRRVVALGGLDAHGGIGRHAEDGTRSNIPGVPSYLASFAAFSVRVELDRQWSGDAAADARALLNAIRRGRVYTEIDGVASGGLLDFHADTNEGSRIPMGGQGHPGANVTLVARALKPDAAHLVLMHDGRELTSTTGELRQAVDSSAGAFRIEVRVPGAPGNPPIPWIVSNPIYFLAPPETVLPSELRGEAAPLMPPDWHIEKDPASSAILRTSSGAAELEYSLAPGNRRSQYAAIAANVPAGALRGVRLQLSADRPTRLSIQLRDAPGQRWGSSQYVSSTPGELSVPAEQFRPIADAPSILKSSINSLLVVVDLTNASPGRTGTIKITSAQLVR
jgi:hypothetical protein